MHVWPCEEGGTFIIDHGGGREREREREKKDHTLCQIIMYQI